MGRRSTKPVTSEAKIIFTWDKANIIRKILFPLSQITGESLGTETTIIDMAPMDGISDRHVHHRR